MIEARGADQEARREFAVEDLGFTVRSGTVTSFLGSDVAGKRRRTGSSPRLESWNQTNLGSSLSHRAPLHERRVRPVVRRARDGEGDNSGRGR
jgi:hypothetical protein